MEGTYRELKEVLTTVGQELWIGEPRCGFIDLDESPCSEVAVGFGQSYRSDMDDTHYPAPLWTSPFLRPHPL